MPQIHEVEGVGLMEFPDEATEQDIQAALNEYGRRGRRAALGEQMTSARRVRAAGDFAESAIDAASNIVHGAAPQNWPEVAPQIGVQLRRLVTDDEEAARATAEEGVRQAGQFAADTIKPALDLIPGMRESDKRGLSEGLGHSAAGLALGLPDVAELLAAGAANPAIGIAVGAGFAKDMLKGAVEKRAEAKALAEEGDDQGALRANVEAGLSALMGGGIMGHGTIRAARERAAPVIQRVQAAIEDRRLRPAREQMAADEAWQRSLPPPPIPGMTEAVVEPPPITPANISISEPPRIAPVKAPEIPQPARATPAVEAREPAGVAPTAPAEPPALPATTPRLARQLSREEAEAGLRESPWGTLEATPFDQYTKTAERKPAQPEVPNAIPVESPIEVPVRPAPEGGKGVGEEVRGVEAPAGKEGEAPGVKPGDPVVDPAALEVSPDPNYRNDVLRKWAQQAKTDAELSKILDLLEPLESEIGSNAWGTARDVAQSKVASEATKQRATALRDDWMRPGRDNPETPAIPAQEAVTPPEPSAPPAAPPAQNIPRWKALFDEDKITGRQAQVLRSIESETQSVDQRKRFDSDGNFETVVTFKDGTRKWITRDGEWSEPPSWWNEVAPLAAPPPPVAPEAPNKGKGKRTGSRLPWTLGPRSDGVYDILDAIQEEGGIRSPSSLKHPGGEYDGFKEAFVGPARLLISRSANASPVDVLMISLRDRGYKFETPDDFYRAVKAAVDSRETLRRRGGLLEEQREKFWQAATDPRSKIGLVKMSSDELKPGDEVRFKVQGASHEPFTVTDVDADGLVTLRDGPKFRNQEFPEGTEIWVKRGSHDTSKRVEEQSAEDAWGVEPETQPRFAATLTDAEREAGLTTGGEREFRPSPIDIAIQGGERPKPAAPATPPPQVVNRVKAALSVLRDAQAELDRVKMSLASFDAPRYMEDVLRNRADEIAKARATLAEFRRRAPDNKVDAEAFIESLGGEPKLELPKPSQKTPSPKPAVSPVDQPQVRDLTKAEQDRLRELVIKNRRARDAGGEPLTTEERAEYDKLMEASGQMNLLGDTGSSFDGQIKALTEKVKELDRQRQLTQKRAWESRHRRYELLQEVKQYQEEIDRVIGQIKDLRARKENAKPVQPSGQGELLGMGGAVPAEFEHSGKTATSIKNAVVDQERVARGEKPMMAPARVGREEVWDRAMGMLDKDPTIREKLVAELNQRPRAINDFEVALLDHLRVDLKNEYAKSTREARQAADDGRIEDMHQQNAITQMWSDKLVELEKAAGKGGAGTETARGLAYRRHMVADDFSFVNLELEARRARGWRPLTEDERAALKTQADAYKAKADALEARVTRLEKEAEAKAVEEALRKAAQEAEAESRPSSIVVQIAEQISASWDRRADAARNRIRERMKTMSAGVDPTIILDLAEVGLGYMGRGTVDALRFGERLVKEFGEWVKPHVDQVWAKVQELVEKEKAGAKPASPKVEAIEGIEAGTIETGNRKGGRGTRPAETDQTIVGKIGKKLGGKDRGDISVLVRKLARWYVGQGTRDLNLLVDQVHAALRKVLPDMTRREAMDAISGYGKFKPLPKDTVSVVLRDLSGQGQQIAKLEDMMAGTAPLKTGKERRIPSDQERLLIKQVQERKKQGGYTVTDPATQLRSAMQTVHTRLENQIKDLELQIANRAKIIRNPTKLQYDARAQQLQARRDELRAIYDEIFAKPELTDAERLARWKDRVRERTSELKARLAAGDFSKPPRRAPVPLDREALRLRFDMRTIERQIMEGRAAEARRLETLGRRGVRTAAEVLNTMRAAKTSFDLSAVLRQGGFIAFAHPIRAARSIPDMLKATFSEREAFRVAEEIRNRENAPLYEQSKLYLAEHGGRLSAMEEAFMSRWAEKIPGIRASQRGYVAFLNKLRADSFDAMAATLGKHGQVSLPEAKVIANFINVATGRGSVALDKAAVTLNTVFFAPRYVASRFQLLAGQPIWGAGEWKGTGRVRGMVAKEYARTLAGAAVVYALAGMAGGDVGTDPNSSDFGKIIVGDTRIDPLFGLSQSTVLMSRASLGTRTTLSGKTKPIRGKLRYGEQDFADVMANFMRSKLSPAIGESINLLAGTDVAGREVEYDPLSLTARFIGPIGVGDILDAARSEGIPVASVLSVLSILGMGLQTHDRN